MEWDVDKSSLAKYRAVLTSLPDGDFKAGAEETFQTKQEQAKSTINDYAKTRLKILDTLEKLVDFYPKFMGTNHAGHVSDEDLAKFNKLRTELNAELAHRNDLDTKISDARRQLGSELSSLEHSTREYGNSQ